MKTDRNIVQIIGSTRFKDDMMKTAWELSRKGWVVILPLFRPEGSKDIDEELLEDIGFFRITKADIVLVYNKDNYTGSSTRKEIQFCKLINKEMVYLEGNRVG